MHSIQDLRAMGPVIYMPHIWCIDFVSFAEVFALCEEGWNRPNKSQNDMAFRMRDQECREGRCVRC